MSTLRQQIRRRDQLLGPALVRRRFVSRELSRLTATGRDALGSPWGLAGAFTAGWVTAWARRRRGLRGPDAEAVARAVERRLGGRLPAASPAGAGRAVRNVLTPVVTGLLTRLATAQLMALGLLPDAVTPEAPRAPGSGGGHEAAAGSAPSFTPGTEPASS